MKKDQRWQLLSKSERTIRVLEASLAGGAGFLAASEYFDDYTEEQRERRRQGLLETCREYVAAMDARVKSGGHANPK